MFALSSVRRRIVGLVFLLGLIGLLAAVLTSAVSAQTSPDLGTAVSFAVLGGSTVTNTGSSVIGGNLGVSPGTAITGFPPGHVTPPGKKHAADAVAGHAQDDVTTAYNNLMGQPCPDDLTGQDLGGLTLTEGVYCFSSSAQLTGTLTLNAEGNAAAVFIFQMGSTLTTATDSSVVVENGGTGCNVWWQVGSSATLGTTTAFEGNILALTSITLNTGATMLPGRALARNGAVTLDTNTINETACFVLPTPTATRRPAHSGATPTPVPFVPTAVPTNSEVNVSTGSQASAQASGSVVGLPNTGGGPPQATYWFGEQEP